MKDDFDSTFSPAPLDLLFEHSRPDGSSERLVLTAGTCPDPNCKCRKISYYGYLVPGTGTEDLIGRELDEPVLYVDLDIDTGTLNVTQGAPELVGWLEDELRGMDLVDLRRRHEQVRREVRREFDEAWKTVDWSFWEPGMRIGWQDAHPTFGAKVLQVQGRQFIILDSYCVAEDCQCEDVSVEGFEIVDDRQAEEPVFVAQVVPGAGGTPTFKCSPGELPLARAIWEAWAASEDLPAVLAERRRKIRVVGVELWARWGARRTPIKKESKPAANQPCPCGSGKKYKRCCGR